MSTKIPVSFPSDKGKMRSIMRIIIEEPILFLPIPFIEKGILSLAKSFTDNGSRLYLSDEELSKPLFTHRMTVNRAIQNLVKLGYLEKRVESREGGKSYRSLKYVGVEHSNKLYLCSDSDDESIATNCISDSNKLHLCSPSIATNCITHSNKLHHITKRNLKDHNLKVTERVVADAPLPTKPELKDSLIDLEPVKEPLDIQEAPPIPAAPPKAQKPKKPDLTIDAVDALEVPDEVKAAAKRWFEHKQLIKNPIKVRTLLREITKYGHGLPVVVQRSISSNYDGLWPIKYQDLDEVADEAVNKLFVCMSEDGDWVEAGRSNPLLRDSLNEYMGANGIDDKQTFKNKAEGSGRTFILKDIKKIYIRKMKQTFNNI